MAVSKIKSKIIKNPLGMHDLMGDDALVPEELEQKIKSIAQFYGFERIDTPVVEDARLFLRGRKEISFLPEKELIQFRSPAGDAWCLRPEGFLPVLRSYVENNMADLPHPLKFFYSGQFFRDEALRKGYQKMFHQLGLVMIGEDSAVAEAEILQILFLALSELGFKNLFIHLNSIGCFECRPTYRSQLSGYYRFKTHKLCKNCKRHFKHTPLKLLECTEEKCAVVRQNAPQVLDSLCEICKNSFKELLEFLDEVNVPYILDPHLIGTFNYYSRTVFKIYTDSGLEKEGEKEKTLALGSGGRFDKLAENIGGKPVAAVGGVVGLERVWHAIKKAGRLHPKPVKPRIFLVQLGTLAKRKSLALLEALRLANIPVQESLGKDSIKSQLKIAERIGAEVALILGQKEAIDRTVIVREMNSGIQETTPQEKLLELLKRKLSK